MKSYGVTFQMKPLWQNFHSVLFIQYVVLTFESVDEILWCYLSNETSLAELLHSTSQCLGFFKKEMSVIIYLFIYLFLPLLGMKGLRERSLCHQYVADCVFFLLNSYPRSIIMIMACEL